MCVTCLFKVHELSLLSTKYVALRTSYNIEIAQHKHTIQTKHNQTRQIIEKCVGTPDYPSGIPDMHTIHDPMISVS
jgi:hypothetical protein